MGQSLFRPILDSLGVYELAGIEGDIFDAGVAIDEAFECAGLITLLGGDVDTETTLTRAYQGMRRCLARTASRDAAIADFERLLASRGKEASYIGEIFRLAVAGKPYSTPESIKEARQKTAQQPTPTPASKRAHPTPQESPPGDAIDQLFAGLGGNGPPTKVSVPTDKAPARTAGSSSPASSPRGSDEIDRLFNQIGTSSSPAQGSNGGDESDEIDRLFDGLGP